MSRFARKDGLVVSVADHKDDRYATGWKKLADGEQPPAPRRTRQQHDEPTPSGRIPRQQNQQPAGQAEETATGQIRRMQAQDPFYGR